MGGHWWTAPEANHAFILSWFSVVVTIFAVIGGFVTAKLTGSSLILAYGVENLVDFLSSAVVLWRFYCPSQSDPVREAILAKREQRASIAISMILVILGFGIIIAAIGHLVEGPEGDDEESDRLIIIGMVSIFVFGFMTFIKFHYSSMLSSSSLQKDAICSLIGTVLAISLVVNSIIIKSTSKAWFLDPIIALLCGIGSLHVALKSIYSDYVIKGIPILSPRWWISSQGEGEMPTAGPFDLDLSTDDANEFDYDKEDKGKSAVELPKNTQTKSEKDKVDTNKDEDKEFV